MTQTTFIEVRRHALWLAFSLCLLSFGAALVLQHVFAMEPCPLCIVQRYFILLCAVLALGAALASRPGVTRRVVSALLTLAALGGAATSVRHMWVQKFPPPSQGCLPGLDYMLEQMPLTQALPLLFKGSADCSVIDALFLGITIPQACLAVFLTVIGLVFAGRGLSKTSTGR